MIIFYTLIFFSLRRRQKQEMSLSPVTSTHTKGQSSLDYRQQLQSQQPPSQQAAKGHHPAFLIYPVIYVACTAPLALGRIATMAGAKVPLGYFCAAGALITSNGWLDVLLWGLTRRALLFNSEVDTEDVGIETFAFMRTPPGRKYGNMVWVQGATGGQQDSEDDEAKDGWGWWGWPGRRRGRGGAGGNRSGSQRLGHRRKGSRSISQERLRGGGRGDGMAGGIQMDLVTTVVVEVDADKVDGSLREYSLSVNDSEKDGRPGR